MQRISQLAVVQKVPPMPWDGISEVVARKSMFKVGIRKAGHSGWSQVAQTPLNFHDTLLYKRISHSGAQKRRRL
jgi:hypothetical protein